MRRRFCLLSVGLVLNLAIFALLPDVVNGQERQEIIQKRARCAKFFDNGDGTYRAELFASPIHYMDNDSNWQDIDPTIRPFGQEGFGYACETNSLKFYFSDDKVKIALSDDLWLELELRGEVTNMPGSGDSPGYGQTKIEDVRIDTIRYRGIDENVDLEFIVGANSLKGQIVIENLSELLDSLSADMDTLIVKVFSILTPGCFSVYAKGREMRSDFITKGKIEFRDEIDRNIYAISKIPNRVNSRLPSQYEVRFKKSEITLLLQIPISSLKKLTMENSSARTAIHEMVLYPPENYTGYARYTEQANEYYWEFMGTPWVGKVVSGGDNYLFRGWIQWDTGDIEDEAEVSNIDLRLTYSIFDDTIEFTEKVYMDMYHSKWAPATWNPPENAEWFYNSMTDPNEGSVLAVDNYSFPFPGSTYVWPSFGGEEACARLQWFLTHSLAGAQDFFTVYLVVDGWNDEDQGDPPYLTFCGYDWDQDKLPQLTVTYTIPEVEVTVQNNFSGGVIQVDGGNHQSPYVTAWEPGSQHWITAISPQTVGEVTYAFDHWSDGGARSHQVVAGPNDTIFTAFFESGYPPEAPENLTATPKPERIDLSWEHSEGATSYKLHYGTSSGDYTEEINVGYTDSYILYDDEFVPGQTYYFAVTAHNPFGASGYSNEASAVCEQNYSYLPSTPEIYPEPDGFTYNMYPEIIALDDINGDGFLDVALGASSYSPPPFDYYGVHDHEFWNDGSGGFNDYVVWYSYGMVSEPVHDNDYDFGDMNNDGKRDLAIARSFRVEVHLNEGNQLSSSSAWMDTLSTRYGGVAWGKVNNDGWDDLAVSRYEGVAVYFNDQEGNLHQSPDWTTSYKGDIDWGKLGYFNDDDYPELAIGYGNDILIFANDNGNLSSSPTQIISTGEEVSSIIWWDMDGDGYQDIVIGTSSYEGRAKLFLNNQEGLINSSPVWTSDPDFSWSPCRIAIGDVNLDGRPDLALTDRNGDYFHIYFNSGDGSVLKPEPGWWTSFGCMGTHIGNIELGDIDNTGRFSLLASYSWGDVMGNGGGGLLLFRNTTPVVIVQGDGGQQSIPQSYSLSQNYPNPFNPVTQISYTLPKECSVKLEVFNILGQKVTTLVDEKQKAGYKSTHWDAGSVASGIYIYRLKAGDFTETKRMVLLR